MSSQKNIIVIGSGFSGLTAAATIAKAGHNVKLLEKNSSFGGRARKFHAEGFTFDMGPSWYWMPEVFEEYYNKFGYKTSDFYTLKRLDPSYRVYFDNGEHIDVPADYDELRDLFESMEPGAAAKLDSFLKEAEYKYKVGMDEFVWKPSNSITEFMDLRLLKSAFRLEMFSSISSSIRKLFSNDRIIKILEFPVLFLGATPQDTPALYSLMNYADLKLGTWYPEGGMYKIVEAMIRIAEEQGVELIADQEVLKVESSDKMAKVVKTADAEYHCEAVIVSGDYHHFDQHVLAKDQRNYSADYWDKRTMAPSSLLYYLGIDKKLDGLKHHTLFFDEDFELHAQEIYKTPKWPTAPLFYCCSPSRTDMSVAPEAKENVFLLMPLAAELDDAEENRERYFNIMLDRLKSVAGHDIKNHIVYKRSYCLQDFQKDYHAFKGNAYGLANTLKQTAILKPRLKSKRMKNLFFTGQLTVPGPGVPPSIISGQLAAMETLKIL